MNICSRKELWWQRRISMLLPTLSSRVCPTFRLGSIFSVSFIFFQFPVKLDYSLSLILLVGYQGTHLPEVSWLREGTVRLETLLLELDQRGNPVSSWLPSPSTRDCSRHPQETASERDQTSHIRCTKSRRCEARGRQRGLQKGWWQDRSRRTWISSHGI